MWKPADVVPQHRPRAVVLFVGLVVALASYTGLLLYRAVEKRSNPSTSFVLSNDLYRYPDIYICLYNFFGCDAQELEGDCANSAHDTDGGEPTAIFNPGGAEEQLIRPEVLVTDEKGWCVVFYASEVKMPSSERDPEDYILLNMFWYPGGGANQSTTCISQEGEWESHSESVFVTLRDASTEKFSGGIQTGYTCVTEASNSHVFSFMGIGLAEEAKLGGKFTASYKALTTSSVIYKDKRNTGTEAPENPYAWLSMEIAQAQDSLEIITEVNPLEIAEIFGNIGGFWDLLLLVWPLFFVAASQTSPNLKARSFKAPLRNAEEGKNDFSGTTVIFPPLRRRRGLTLPSGQLTFRDGEIVQQRHTINQPVLQEEPQPGGTPQGAHVEGVASQCSGSPPPSPAVEETPQVFTPTFLRQRASTWASLVGNAQQRLRPAAAPRSRSGWFPAAAMSNSARAAGTVTV